MDPLQLHSERYAPTGNLAAEGARNQLGRPALSPLAVLVRESVQNSWDARDRSTGRARYEMNLSRLSEQALKVLNKLVFADTTGNGELAQRLADAREEALWALTLSDRGTVGLGGPTRADVIDDDAEHRHFVDFLRNIGQPPEDNLGGGTYGYGKAALYAVSGVRTILVYTRCREGEALQTRFIAAALGRGFQLTEGEKAGRYTGRHWWGRERSGFVEPLLNKKADTVAAALGMPGFEGEECGTSILILDFQPGEEFKNAQAMQLMVQALVWNFWPKLVPTAEGHTPMTFSASFDGRAYPIPKLSSSPHLQGMAQALAAIRQHRAGKKPSDIPVIPIRHGQFNVLLGRLALTRVFQEGGVQMPPTGIGAISTVRAHHVALMRGAELVVRYEEREPLEVDLFGYVGVFVTESEVEVDRAFAAAEPPTHDDWEVKAVSNPRQQSYVRVALKHIRREVDEFIAPGATERRKASGTPLGIISTQLGGLLTGLPGPGGGVVAVERTRKSTKGPVLETEPEPPTDPPEEEVKPVPQPPDGDKPGETKDRPVIVGRPRLKTRDPRLVVRDGVPLLELDVEVKHGRNSRGTRLTVDASAVIDGGHTERSPPAGAPVPRIWSWKAPDGAMHPTGAEHFEIPPDAEGTWTVSVRLIDDAEVRVKVQGYAVRPE